MSELREALASVTLFRALDEARRAEIASIASRRRVGRDELIFAEDEPAKGMYAILAGRVKVFKAGPEGKEQILRIWEPGEIFGEAPALWGGYYPASAMALEPGELLWIPRDRLLEAIRTDPELALALLAALSKRLHHLTGLVEELSLREVPARLAGYLIGLPARGEGEDTVVELEVSKAQLAASIGTIPETLSRALGRLTREGLIAAESPRRIRLLDLEGLEEVAAGQRRLR
jgi:CRP/FNR family transcriptional regulator